MDFTRRAVLAAFGSAALAPRAMAQDGPVMVPMQTVFGLPWVTTDLNDARGLRFAMATQAGLFRADRPSIRAGHLTTLPLRNSRDQTLYRADLIGIGGAYGFRSVEVVEAGDGGEGVLFHGAMPLMQDRPSLYDFPAGRFTPGWAVTPDFVGAGMVSAGLGRERWMRKPAVQATLDGVSLTLLIDTESPYAVSLNGFGVKRHGLWDRWSGGYDRRAWFAGAERRGHSVRVRRAGALRFMDWTLEGPVIGVSDPDGADGRDPGVDGRIGMDVLRRFALGFEPDGWRVHAKASDRLDAPFRHDRSGLQVGPRDGAMVVLAVDPGSPAEVAGARVGDTVPELTARGATGLEWATSDPAAASFDLAVQRDGQTVPLRIALTDRL